MRVWLAAITILFLSSPSAFGGHYSDCLEKIATDQTQNLQCGQFTQEFLAPIFGNARLMCSAEIKKDMTSLADGMAIATQAQEKAKALIEKNVTEKMNVCGDNTYFKINEDGKGGTVFKR